MNGEHCYIVSKDDLDTYMARKESLEKTKGTPEWYLSNRLKQLEAENTNLRDINKSLGEEHSKLVEENETLKDAIGKYYNSWLCGDRVCSANCELKAANEKLAAEVDELKEKIKELGVIKSFLEVGNEKWIARNTELKSRNRYLELENAKLRGELSRADDELAKFYGEHTVEFLYEKHEDGKHFIGWTEVSGEEYELTFLTPERKIHE